MKRTIQTAKPLVAVGSALIASIVLAACGGSSASTSTATTASGGASKAPAFKSGNYALGELNDLTGGFSSVDVPWHKGIVVAINAANAAGGINGHKVNLYSRDSQGNGPVSTAAFQQLVSQYHVSAIMGVGDSLVDAAIYPLATAAHIPVTPVGAPDSELGPNAVMFQYGPSSVGEAKTMVSYAASLVKAGKLKSAKIATVPYNDPNGASWVTHVRSAATAAGLTFVANIPVAPTATDYSSVAAKFASSGANIIFTEVAGASATTLMQALSAAGIPQTTPLVGYSWSIAPSMPWANFHAVTDYRELGSQPGVVKFQAAMKAGGFSITSPFMNEGYADGELVLSALKSCGYPCSASQLYDQLNKTNTTLGGLAFGPVVWSSTYRQGPTSLAVAKYNTSGVVQSYQSPTVVATP